MPQTTLTPAPQDTGVARALAADPSQAAVLALPDGRHAAVLGAPGTGKTSTLSRLVAARLTRADAISPDGHATVLALTSARSAATALRDRLAAAVDRVIPGALARTVNSLAFQIVAHAAAVQGQETPTLLTGGEQDRIIADLLEGHELDGTGPEWPSPITAVVRERAGFRTALRDVMMRAVAAGVEPEDMRELGDDAGRPEWRAVGDFVDEYRAAVTAFRSTSLDAAELVAYATAAVLRGQVPASVAALRLVVVDDTQELVEGEIALLGALARSGVQVVAFGDPDIAASAFRGAEPDVLGRLAVRLGVDRVDELVLATVHRHPAPIRALVSDITARIGAAAAGRQRTATATSADARTDAVVHLEGASRAALVVAVARRLREHRLLDGVPWHRMAVVTRSGAAIPELVRALSVAEVPATAGAAPVRPRDDTAARSLLDAAAVALGVLPLDAALATAFATGPLGGLDTLAMRRLRLALRREELAGGGTRTADELLVDALGAPERLATVDAGFARRATRLARSLVRARTDADSGSSIEEILWGSGNAAGSPAPGAASPLPVVSAPPRRTGTSTRWSACSPRRSGSSSARRTPRRGCSSTTCSALTCPRTPSARTAPPGASACSRPPPPSASSATWSSSSACRTASGRTPVSAAASSIRTVWSGPRRVSSTAPSTTVPPSSPTSCACSPGRRPAPRPRS
ncbi:AAA family ATPase [Curtobacterium flaccumfaciens]|nr:AAA family ATPase [Curtobacterium flaccumfaciens]